MHPYKLPRMGGMQQFGGLLGSKSKSRHLMKAYSSFRHCQTPPTLPSAHAQSRLPFQAGYSTRKLNSAKAQSITPEVFQVNAPKLHEKTNFGLPLQGADVLKSKHSGPAETELF